MDDNEEKVTNTFEDYLWKWKCPHCFTWNKEKEPMTLETKFCTKCGNGSNRKKRPEGKPDRYA